MRGYGLNRTLLAVVASASLAWISCTKRPPPSEHREPPPAPTVPDAGAWTCPAGTGPDAGVAPHSIHVLDCMPPNPPPGCSNGYREWVLAKCPGALVTD